MEHVISKVEEAMKKSKLNFLSKPILIGGLAMEYYGIRKAGSDIDLIIQNADYELLAKQYPHNRKDLYGDLGVVINEFEIWRSIAHLDYHFFAKDAVDAGTFFVLSIDRLLWTRVCAMDVEKYWNDLKLIKEYYYKRYTNQEYHQNALTHERSYQKKNGLVLGGAYEDA